MLSTLLLALQVMQAEPPPAVAHAYNGRAVQTRVAAPHIEAEARIDGVLDDAAWRDAAVMTGFSQYRPVEGRAAEDSTEVRVWYSSRAIYFGIHAFAPAGGTRAKLADRDKIDADDYVQIMLDTFNDHRQAFVFGVNPLGVQSDGTRTEGAAGGATSNAVDLSADFVYESRGRLTDDGYEVEVRIPFKSLRFQSARVQDWGINIFRKIQHSGFEDTWTRTAKAASFLAQSGTLSGLRELSRGLVLDLNPVTTTRLAGASTEADTWHYSGSPEFGGNVRWGLTSSMTLNGTANPDFSQVEADVGQVAGDARFALSFPEKRPFFIEGSDLFNTPNGLVYTRRITSPLGALKLTGKAAGTTIGVLSAMDARSGSFTGADHPLYTIARLRKDLGRQSTLGVTYTDRADGGNYNRMINADTRLVFRKLYFVQLQYAQSFTRTPAGDISGPLWQLWYDRTGKYFGFGYNVLGISPDFRAASGFIPRTGVVQPRFNNRFSVYGRQGALMQAWTITPQINGTWDYDEFFKHKTAREWRSSFANAFTLRRGWTVGATIAYEEFRFDEKFHAGQYVNTVTGGGISSIVPFHIGTSAGTRSIAFNAVTPQFPKFSSSLVTRVGKDADFFEHSTADVLQVSWIADWVPTQKARVQGIYTHLDHRRARDGTLIDRARIPRIKLEYQLSRPIFFRWVAQYDARTRSALRDPRTDQPLLLAGTNGQYTPIGASASNDFRMDWLFSYRPNPGTVIFAGYGSSLTEPIAFTFRDVGRVSDAFFFKISYLFRM